MDDPKYQIPAEPSYRLHGIRKLQDNDLADVCLTFNPVIEPILESIEHVHQQAGSMVARRELTVPPEGWAGGAAEYDGFFVDVPQPDITEDMAPTAALHPESYQAAAACGLCGVCRTLDGAIRFYAKLAPTAPLAVTVVLSRAGEVSAGAYVMPVATPDRVGGGKIGENISQAGDGTISVQAASADELRKILLNGGNSNA